MKFSFGIMAIGALLLTQNSWADEETTAKSLNFEPGTLVANDGERIQKGDLPFWLYVPSSYRTDADDSFPLLLFLHGFGESGTGGEDLERVKIHGPSKMAAAGHPFPFVIVAPQCPPPNHTREAVFAAWSIPKLTALLNRISKDLRVDADRVYVTGLSMGGCGTWRLAAAHPERFAAAAPICGIGPVDLADKLKRMPIWCFHGGDDQVVPVSFSEQMCAAVRKAGGEPKLTIYDGVGHNSWEQTYNNPDLFEWLLSHQRESARPAR